jgi:tRNA (guanine37-N1)-methyltransferase
LTKRLIEMLSQALSPEELSHVYGSFDIVGDIAIIRLTEASSQNAKRIADAVMMVHGNVKTVLAQTDAVGGKFRLRRLTYISGENRTHTIHRESGCVFSVDLESCYFSPRLSHERSRIASLVQPDEMIVNMFAGVGCFSIIIAKHVNSAKVYSIDINPKAFRFMIENIRLNRAYEKVIPILGDAKAIIENQLSRSADRVLMPLPEKAFEYLPHAMIALKPPGGWIHVHTFEHTAKTENPVEKAKEKVKNALDNLGTSYEIPVVRVVRSTGPNWWQLVADVHIN